MPDSNLRKSDRELIFDLAHKLTGTMEGQATRHEIVISNVMRRMAQTGRTNLLNYLDYVSESETELAHFISAVTIHTTGWFREMPHYRKFERQMFISPSKLVGRTIRLLSAASSTGEELYSFGMILESIRRQYPTFNYELVGFDVDPICVQKADAGYYAINDLTAVPQNYRPYLIPNPKKEGTYNIDPDIRRRTSFHVGNLLDPDSYANDQFDFIVCRNVLIYFSEEKTHQIVSNLRDLLKPQGILTLGHSEAVDANRVNLIARGESSYMLKEEPSTQPARERSITVLSIDNTPSVRMWMATELASKGIRVLSADSVEAANEILSRNRADLITLDLNLPNQSARQFLTDFRNGGATTPVILLTETHADQASEVLEVLSIGSQDYFNKIDLQDSPAEFAARIKDLVTADRQRASEESVTATYSEFKDQSQVKVFNPDLILVGASTGGTDALCQLLARLPQDCPPIVCVQHIPREFAPAFLDRLSRASGLIAGTPEKGRELQPGHIFLSTADAHIGVKQSGPKITAYYSHTEKVSGHRPSVDYLFQTASFIRNKNIMAFLLTGMGRDGAQGLLELRRTGALTLAQDERSSVVWGMPGEAVKLGAPVVVGNIKELRDILLQCCRQPKATPKAS